MKSFSILWSLLSFEAMTLSKTALKLILCFAGILLLISQLAISASGSVLEPVTDLQLIKESDIIFEGMVQKVEYRLSNTSSKHKNSVPHTFVTFEVKKIFKGNTEGNKIISLRFAGGPYDKSRILLVSGIPLFDRGDRDILCVTGNRIRICPLVGWSQGRFRIIKDKVYTDDGREVQLSDKNSLEYGKRHEFKEVQTHHISGKLLRQLPMDAKKEKEEQKLPIETTNRSLSYEKFASYISQLIINNHDSGELRSLRPVKSADMKEEFFFKITPVRPPLKN